MSKPVIPGKKSSDMLSKTYALKPWIPDLARQTVNDDKWYCYCTMIIEAKPFYRVFTNEFETICQYGYRKYVRCISMSDIIKEVWVNATRKGINTPLAHLCDEIRRSVGKHIGKSLRIPAMLLASLIKYIILDMKQRDIKRKENLKMIKTINKTSKINTGEMSKSAPMTASKGGQGKIKTKLHKRGEEMKCLVSVMDCPPNGPDLYIFLLQFQDVILPFELYKVGILLTSIIQVGYSDLVMKGDTNFYRKKMQVNAKRNIIIRTSVAESVLSAEVYLHRITLFQDVRYFWIEFFNYLRDVNYFNCFKDLALMKFIPSLHFKPTSMHFLEDLRTDIYNGMITIMYNIVCLKSCYESHLEEMDVVEFEDAEHIEIKNLKYYNRVLDSIPLEALTVSLILDSLVAEVCLNTRDNDIGYEISKYSFLMFDDQDTTANNSTKVIWLKEVVKQLNIENNLFETDEEDRERKLLVKSKDYPTQNIISVIREDEIMLSSIHLPPDQREFIKDRSIYLIKLFWDKIMWEKIILEHMVFPPNQFNSYVDQMASYFKLSYGQDVLITLASLSEMERLFSSPSGKFNNLSIEQTSDVYSTEYLQNLISEMMTHNKSNVDSILNKRDLLRKMKSDVLLQKLDKDFKTSGCLIWKYFPFLDKALCKCFDFSRPRKKDVVLPTLVTFRDFIECVFYDKIVDWEAIEKQFRKNKIYYDNHEVNFFDQEISYNLIFPLYVNGMQLNYIHCIPKNSSEYQIIKEKAESINEEKNENYVSPTSSSESSYKEQDLESSKKFIYNTGTQRRTVYSYSDTELSFNSGLKMGIKFEGELIGTMLLSFLAKFRDLHNINYHKVLVTGRRSTAHSLNHESTLTIEHCSGMIFSIQKIKELEELLDSKFFEHTQSQYTTSQFTPSITMSNIESVKTHQSSSLYEPIKSGIFHFNLSWPSGLQISLVPREGLQYYIKQNYIHSTSSSLSEVSKELFRCFLPEGVVLKFMKDDTVILLHANGKIIHCYEYEWKGVNVENQSNQQLDLSKDMSLIMLRYRIRFPDGKVKIYEKGSWFSGNKIFVTDFFNLLDDECKTECSEDIFVHKKNGFLSVHYSDGTKIISKAKFQKFTIPSQYLFDPNVNDQTVELKETTSEIPGDYVFVEIEYFKMQHPYFATTIFSPNTQEIQLKLPHKTELRYYEDGNISLDLKDEVKIYSNDEGKIVATETFEGQIRNKIIFSLDCEVGRLPSPCISYTDNIGNYMIVDDDGDVKINDMSNENDSNRVMNESFFVFDENYDGIQFHTVDEIKKLLEPIKNNLCTLIKVDKNDTYSEKLVMEPFSTDMPWKMQNNEPKILPEEYNLSTFGSSWSHPFQINLSSGDKICLLNGMILQVFKKLNLRGSPRSEFMKVLNRFISEGPRSTFKLNFTEPTPLDQYFLKETEKMVQFYQIYYKNYLDECEKADREKWLQQQVIEPSILVVIYKKRLKKVGEKYKDLKEKILHKAVPSYFESADGNTFLITKEMIKSAREKGCERYETNKLDRLLNENLKDLTVKDFIEIKRLLEKDKRGIWSQTKRSKYTLEEVLEAGSSLYPYFKNMRAVLTFHKNMQKEID